jgi:hypothetical protein
VTYLPQRGLGFIFVVILLVGGISASSCTAAASKHPIYVSVTGADTNDGTAAAPVLTLGRAYQLAQPGQTVDVTAGDYPYQLLSADSRKQGTKHVVFQPAPGAGVNVSAIDFGQGQQGIPGPSHVTIRDMSIGYIRAWQGTNDVLWQNITGSSFGVISATHLTIRGGSFGPCLAPRDANCTPLLLGSNLLVDGVAIHDQTLVPGSGAHVDGMFIRGCQTCTVRNSKFWGNMITNIRIQDCCGNVPNSDITLQNNFFAAPLTGAPGGATRFDAVDFDTPIPNLRIISNSMMNSGIGFVNAVASAPALVTGNIFGRAGCDPNATYAYNVFVPFSQFTGQQSCSGTDRKLSSFDAIGYANAGTDDLHLVPHSPAMRFVAPRVCPSTDIDGQRRWPGRRCDAGADQRSLTICRRVGQTRRFVTAEVDPNRLSVFQKHGAKLGPCHRAAAKR